MADAMTRPHSVPHETSTADAQALAARVGLTFTTRQSRQLADFALLLQKWNAVYNLTAIRTAAAIETHHLLDSLALVVPLRRCCDKSGAKLLDVGSGGGLPGIPLAIACPDLRVTLLDANGKKCAFLTQARVELGLANVEVVHARVERWAGPRFDLVVARAFSSLRDLVALTRHLISENGVWLAMKGAGFVREADPLPEGVTIVEVLALDVPGLKAARNVVVLRMAVRPGAEK